MLMQVGRDACASDRPEIHADVEALRAAQAAESC